MGPHKSVLSAWSFVKKPNLVCVCVYVSVLCACVCMSVFCVCVYMCVLCVCVCMSVCMSVVYVYMCVCVHIYVCEWSCVCVCGAHGKWKMEVEFLKLKLQIIVSLPTWVLETRLKSYAKSVCERSLQPRQYTYCSFVSLLKWTMNLDKSFMFSPQALFCL